MIRDFEILMKVPLLEITFILHALCSRLKTLAINIGFTDHCNFTENFTA